MRPEVEVNAQIEGGLAAEVSTIVLDTLEHLVQVSVVYLLTPASQVEVGCTWARGLLPQLHPKGKEHPQAYQPATQPRAPRAQLPTIAPVTLRPEA